MDTAGKPESLLERLRRRFGRHRREARAEDILQMLQQARREQTIGADTLQQLENVLAICRQSKSMAEAGRALFNVSRNSRSTPNDSDRLRKYLARFGLSWNDVVK